VSDPTPNRSSQDAVLPEDVTDPLLWRLGYDVAVAHQPDEQGRCGNLLCDRAATPCGPLTNAQRAMRTARGGAPTTRRPGPRDAAPPAARDRRRRAA
jgi:hypothetical protein